MSHRRSTTAQGMPPHMPPSFARSTFDGKDKRGSPSPLCPASQRLRANSVQEPSQISGKLLHQAATAAAMAAPSLPIAPKLPKHSRETVTIASSLPSTRRSSRADLAENWRTKSQVSSERRNSSQLSRPGSTSRRGSADPATAEYEHRGRSRRSDSMVMKLSESIKNAEVEVLPPLRVSMEPGPVEVLPPLRFSMDPPIKGRSAWRFVLPSPSKDEKTEHDEYDAHLNDLPRWFDGSESDFIVSLGSELPRSISPSSLSSSGSSSSESLSLGSTTPPLDQQGDAECAFSHLSSRCISPALSDAESPPSLKQDPAAFHFAMPMLSAAAPLPSKLPMPSFLRTASKRAA